MEVFVMGELHGKTGPPLGQGAQGGGITEHLRQRNATPDDLGIVHRVHRLQAPPAIADIADNIAGKFCAKHRKYRRF